MSSGAVLSCLKIIMMLSRRDMWVCEIIVDIQSREPDLVVCLGDLAERHSRSLAFSY